MSVLAATTLAATSLWRRELVRFRRDLARVASAAATPLVVWLLLGAGFSGSFRLPGDAAGAVSYLEYFYPGMLVLVLLFAAVFSSITLIEDRREGFLQGVLAAPVSRLALVAGKVGGGATIAWLQAAVLLVLAPGDPGPSFTAHLAAAGVLALLAVQMAAVGFTCAWRTSSVQGFHAVMNLLLIPLWLLSGAFFPLSSAPSWLAAAMRVNPLTYGVAAVAGALHGAAPSAGPAAAGLPPLAPSLAVTGVVTAAAVALAAVTAGAGRTA